MKNHAEASLTDLVQQLVAPDHAARPFLDRSLGRGLMAAQQLFDFGAQVAVNAFQQPFAGWRLRFQRPVEQLLDLRPDLTHLHPAPMQEGSRKRPLAPPRPA